ncbi:MAG: hypothetical protein H0U74_16660 [Bradymonadaceae bacterium]|nr:hypothetical protein [Lujinxingiaceae bacterium]
MLWNLSGTKTSLTLLITLTLSLTLVACGGDNRRSKSTNTTPATSGDPVESKFDIEVQGGSDGPTKLEGVQENGSASSSTWGATIAGDLLVLTLITEGATLSAVVATSEASPAPGSFALSGGTYITMSDATAGEVFESANQGSIKLNNCPKKVGDKAVGSFENVVLKAQIGQGTRSLSGSFDIVIYSKAGDLNCKSTAPPKPANNTTPTNNANSCDADNCENGGLCCPYMECLSACATECIFSEACGLGENAAYCESCVEGCFPQCGVPQSCRDAMVAVQSCDERHGCSLIEREDWDEEDAAQDQCVAANCCAELKAAY